MRVFLLQNIDITQCLLILDLGIKLMALEEKKQYTAFPNFCLRTPFFPLSFYTKLTQNDQISDEEFKGLLEDNLAQSESKHGRAPWGQLSSFSDSLLPGSHSSATSF